MSNHVFCRDVCLERAEPLAGTGKTAARHLLVAWPRGKWRVPRFESVDMSPELSEAIRLAMKTGAHVALVDRVGHTDAMPQLQADGVAADYESEAELVDAVIGWTAGKALTGRQDERIVVLCCTDSRRDACCARHGFATYKGLVEAADPARFNIVQATHVGGCRFAASLIVLPQRQRYGRVEAKDAGAFLGALERGEIYIPSFRGRTDLDEPRQVAELAALQWAQEHGLGQDQVRLMPLPAAPQTGDGGVLKVAADVGRSRLTVSLRLDTILVTGRCTAMDEPAEPTPRWRVEAVKAEA
jgi:hypothetical protein